MNKKTFIPIIIFILLFQLLSFAMSDFEMVKTDYEEYGFKVPEVSVMYVNSFDRPRVLGFTSGGMILIKKSDESLRVLRHEVAHAISEQAIKDNPDGFQAYKVDRMQYTRIKTTWHNVTGNELNQIIQVLMWIYSVTSKEEIVVEDMYFMVYGLQRQQWELCSDPTESQIKQLKLLLNFKQTTNN